jgi:hypothetical protein
MVSTQVANQPRRGDDHQIKTELSRSKIPHYSLLSNQENDSVIVGSVDNWG